MSITLMLLLLLLSAVILAVIFYILINSKGYKKVLLKDSFKLICVAGALNKLFFTGSGYVVSSYFSRNKKLTFYRTLSTFFLLEFVSIFLWIVLGIYFGAKLAVKIPWFFLIFIAVVLLMLWFKREKFLSLVKKISGYLLEEGRRVVLVTPFVILNMLLWISYYFFLFKMFNFYPGILDILKIVSVVIAVSYLSPAPTGLGFKDTSLILLLIEKGLVFNKAMMIAILDRGIVTIFSGILGSVVGFDLIKEEIRRRFKKGIKE